MSVFKIDLTDTPTSFLLLMLIDSVLLREQLTLIDSVLLKGSVMRQDYSLAPAYNELRAEIDRRIPIPGHRA